MLIHRQIKLGLLEIQRRVTRSKRKKIDSCTFNLIIQSDMGLIRKLIQNCYKIISKFILKITFSSPSYMQFCIKTIQAENYQHEITHHTSIVYF